MIYNFSNKLNLQEMLSYKSKLDRLDHLVESLSFCKKSGLILEFGVYQGKTINIISNFFNKESIYGFDSFEGLPEDWKDVNKKILKKGTFSVNQLPTVNSNVNLIKGWFNDTVPSFIEDHKNSIKFLHIDCDLYSSTSIILNLFNDYIIKDTVIVFDEFARWKHKEKLDEFNALQDWIDSKNRTVKFLSRSKSYQAAFRIME